MAGPTGITADSRFSFEYGVQRVNAAGAQQVVGVVALGGLLVRRYVVTRVRFALLIRRRNSNLCYARRKSLLMINNVRYHVQNLGTS